MNKQLRILLAQEFENLTYLSETDAPFEVQTGENDTVREMKFDDFFAPLIKKTKWMADQDRAVAERYRKIKGIIRANTTRRRVYLIGKIQVDVYIFARDLSGSLLVIGTKAVQT
jgi:hypothetical protein